MKNPINKGGGLQVSDNFQIKGLGREVQKSELEIIKFDELLKFNMCPGYLFYVTSETGKPFLLLNPGDVVESEFVEKYQNRGMRSFYILKVVNNQNLREFSDHLLGLKDLKLEWEKINAKNKILKLVSDLYWNGNKNGTVLDFILATNTVFFKLEEVHILQMKKASHQLFTRSLVMGALGVIFALADGVMDFEVLSDVYHSCFLLDYGMMDDNFSFFMTEALEKEVTEPGAGVKYLKGFNLNNGDLKRFEEHGKVGAFRVAQECEGVFFDQSMYSLIKYHHEKNDGTGFPYNMKGSELRSIYTIPCVIDHLISTKIIKFNENDGKSWLKNICNGKEKLMMEILPTKKIWKNFLKNMQQSKAGAEAA